jgi:hypothetical protein
MSAVVSCPKCSGTATLPARASDDGWVRCPICRAEYQSHRLLKYAPPELELIDEPAHPFEGRVPTLEATDELVVAPVGAVTGAIASADVDDDSNVFTFDDSLLLDEPTDELPRVHATDLTEDAAEETDSPAAGPFDWRSANTSQPPPLVETARAPVAADLRATEGHSSAVTIFDRGGPAPVTSVPPIGLAPRRKSRRRSPVRLIVEIVGGGFLGVLIAYAALMWFYHRDPLQIAPRLPGFLVPEALRSTREERVAFSPTEDDAGADVPGAVDSPGMDASKRSLPGNELLPPVEPFGTATTDPGRSNVEPPADPKINPLGPTIDPSKSAESRSTDVAKDPLTDLFGDPATKEARSGAAEALKNPFEAASTDEPVTTKRSATKSGDSTDIPPAVLDELGPVTARRFTHLELMSAIAAAKPTTERALNVPVDADAAQKKKVNGPFYMNLCKIAEALTFLERSADKRRQDRATTAAIEAILAATPDRSRLEELGKLAGYWYERPQGNGIVLSGVVKQSSSHGNLVESVVETLGPARPITVISPSALTDDPSRPVLIVGTIVKDAAKNLRGYQGLDETVVWAEMAIDASNPSPGQSVR